MGLSWGWLRGVFSGLRANRRKARSHRVTGLEDRTLLAAFVVNTLLDTVDANPGDGLALDADGNTSLRAAIIEANALAGADTITLGAGVHRFSLPEADGEFGDLVALNGDLDVISQITITGAGVGQTTIDANQLDRIFEIAGGATLSLSGMTLTGGLANNGGAVLNGGSLNLSDVRLAGNQATVNGGAISTRTLAGSNYVATLIATNTEFVGNSAPSVSQTAGTMGWGGALHAIGGRVTLTNSLFHQNTAGMEGGAITSGGGATVTIDNSTFTENSSGQGGAILFLSGNVTINDSTFIGNRAVTSGGAIRSSGTTLTVNRGLFEDNRTTQMTTFDTNLEGGAIAVVFGGLTTIDGTEFRNNASWRGGALYAWSSGLIVRNSLFEGNTARPDSAQGRGGAVFANTDSGVQVINSTLVGNSSYRGGALASYAGATARWVNCTVTGNTTTGKVIDLDTGDVPGAVSGGTLSNCIVAGNVDNRDIEGNETSVGGNVIGLGVYPVYGFVLLGYDSTDVYGTLQSGPIDPHLLPLADNGGPTPTMALSNASPARDRGLWIWPAPLTDARGVSRSGTTLDAGAYEFQNEAITALPFFGTTEEDTPLVGQLQSSDPDGDPGIFELYPIPEHFPYTMTLQPNGQFVLSPAPNYTGLMVFFYRVKDGHGSTTDWLRSEVTITPVNDPPTAEDQTFTVPENITGFVGSIAFVNDGPYPTFGEIISGNENNAFYVIGNNIYVNRPELMDFETQSSFSFGVRFTDGSGLTDTAAITINLTDVDIPQVADTYFGIYENAAVGTAVINLQLNANPEPGQTVIFSLEDDPTGGAFALNPLTGALTVANSELLEAMFNEAQPFTYFPIKFRTTDSSNPALTRVQNAEFRIFNANDTPVIADQAFSIRENAVNGAAIGTILASDEDPGQTRTFALVSSTLAGALAVNATTGVITVANGSLFDHEGIGSITITVLVTDNGSPALTATRDLVVTITEANEAPVIANQSFAINENSATGSVVGLVIASDVDAGQSLTYAIASTTGAGLFAINAATGEITVADGSLLNYEAASSVTLTIRVTDSASPSLSTTGTVTVNVGNLNEAPVAPNYAFSVNENAAFNTLVGTASATDPDAGTTLTYWLGSTTLPGVFGVNPTNGQITVINNSLLNFEAVTSVTLTVNITDGGNPELSTTSQVTIAINNVNEAPVVNVANFHVAENSANGTSVGFVTVTDPEVGQTHTYSFLLDTSGGAFSINPTTGEITVANGALLNHEAASSCTVRVRAADSGTPWLSGVRDFVIAVDNLNEAPAMNNYVFSIAENSTNGTTVGTVIASDVDAGQIHSYEIVSSTLPGAFSIHATSGVVSVADGTLLNYEAVSRVILTVQATDNGVPALSVSRTVTINLTNVNDAPSAGNRSFFIAENSTSGATVGRVPADDPDGHSLTFSIVSGNIGGAFSIHPTTGIITVASGRILNYEEVASYTLGIRVTDSGSPALSATSTVSVTVQDLNETPLIDAQTFSVAENTFNGEIIGTIIASDLDQGQDRSFTLISSSVPGVVAINAATGEIFVIDSTLLDYETRTSILLNVQVKDKGIPALTASNFVTVNVTNVNERPSATLQSFTISENVTNDSVVGQVIASDVDVGQTLSYAITSSQVPGAFAVNPATGEVTVADSSLIDFESRTSIQLTVTVTDNGTPVLSNNAVLLFRINNLNEAPVVLDQTFSVNENAWGGQVVGTVTATEPDALQSMTYSLESDTSGGAFIINSITGQISVVSGTVLDFESMSTYTLVVRVTDDGNPSLSSTATVAVILADLNEYPVTGTQWITIPEHLADGVVIGTVAASDPDVGQALSYELTGANLPGAFAVNAVTGEVSVANSFLLDYESFPSTIHLTVRVTDNGTPIRSNNAAVLIQLTDVNESPIVDVQSFTIAENPLTPLGAVVGRVIASDVDAGQSLSYSVISSTLPGAFALNATTGFITVADPSLLNYEVVQGATLEVRVTDNGNPALNSLATMTITITDVNEMPTVGIQTYTIPEKLANGTVVGQVIASDVDAGQVLSYAITWSGVPGAFAVNGETGQITIADSSLINFESRTVIQFIVTVTDNGAPVKSNNAQLTFNITNANDAPTIANQSFTLAENSVTGFIVGNVAASDVDAGQSLSYSIVAGNTGGAFAINAATGQITVAGSSALDFETTPSFALTVRVTDNGNPALSSTAQVTISLTNLNDAPTISNQSFTLAENSANGTIIGSVAASDVDAGQSLSYSIASGNTGGAFAIDAATGRITVANAAALDFETTPSFALTVRVTDNGNPALSSTATVTINLTDVIEAIVVGLDVVPGDATNSVKLTGKYDVAILSTATFDARTVNVSTIRFGKNGTEDSISRDKRGNRIFSYRDVNGDGRLDLVVNITNSLTGLGLNDTLAKFSGLTDSGLQILGSSSVRVRR